MELSEEEKQAIKRIKFLIKEIKCQCDICKLNVITFKIILNLIEKQQKEIERLKINLKTKNNFDYFAHKQILGYGYISKDKIREIIEHYNNELEHIENGEEFENEKPMYYWGKFALEELLKEDGDHIPRID